MKVYRCLYNSRRVLWILITLRMTMTILVIVDLTAYKSIRRLSGTFFLMCYFYKVDWGTSTGTSCMPRVATPIVVAADIIQAVESAFITSCCE